TGRTCRWCPRRWPGSGTRRPPRRWCGLRRACGLSGSFGSRSFTLRRQLPDELHRPLNPALQLVVAGDTIRLDQHPALHRPAGDVELLDVRLRYRLLSLLRAAPDAEGVLPDPHQQDDVEQEADPAEQPFLLESFSAC